MDDRIDLRDDELTASDVELDAAAFRTSADIEPSGDSMPHSYSLFADREEEPDIEDESDSPVDLLMKSGQPRLSLVHGDDDADDDVGLIELAPVEATAEAADDAADTWPWLGEVDAAKDEDHAERSSESLEGHYASDLISSPTACGARPTSSDVAQRRPMPTLPRPGEIAAVAQKVGAQFAGDARIQRTPEIPALITSAPRTMTASTPTRTITDRAPAAMIESPAPAPAPSVAASASIASASILPPPATIPNIVASISEAAAAHAAKSARKAHETPKRIGGGKLIQPRLTWKPGDPFADPNRTDGMPGRFRWELMLSTACGTAVFGLAFFWIMRMVF